MKELDRIFFGQSMIWREGFFYAIKYPMDFDECWDNLDHKHRADFKEGWDYATRLKSEHNKELNGG